MQNNDKGQLRKLALSKRNEFTGKGREWAEDKICETLLGNDAVKRANTIMCYVSFRSELQTRKIISELEKQNKALCFPVCGKNGVMQAWHPLNNDAWTTGMMGIREPDVENSRLVLPEEIDLVICPMVAFDEQCRRMGYGGGYYDRYLPQCTKAVRIGIAFEVQRLERIITDAYDQPMHHIITEKKIY